MLRRSLNLDNEEQKSVKILFVVSTLRRTGPTRQLLNLCRGLSERGMAVVVCTLSPEPRDSMLGDFLDGGVQLHQLGLSRMAGLVRARSALNKVIAEVEPDVIHSQGVRADSLNSKLRARAQLCTQRNDPFHDYTLKFGKVLGQVLATQHVRSLRRMPMVVSCSDAIREILEKYRVRSRTVCNAVDTSEYRPGRQVSPEGSVHRAVVVGELSPRKGVMTLLKALAISEADRWWVSIVGTGEQRTECERYVKQHGLTKSVRFVGQVDDVRPYLQDATTIISMSSSEGFPNSLLEGLACGLAPILTNIPAHQEVMSGAPTLASFYEVGDYETLAKILSNWEGPDAAAVREYAVQHHSVSRMVDEYIDVYNRLLMREEAA